jgi:hypothetical protein
MLWDAKTILARKASKLSDEAKLKQLAAGPHLTHGLEEK